MKPTVFFLTVCATVLAQSCSSINVSHDYDPQVNFNNLRTFSWLSFPKNAWGESTCRETYQGCRNTWTGGERAKWEFPQSGLSDRHAWCDQGETGHSGLGLFQPPCSLLGTTRHYCTAVYRRHPDSGLCRCKIKANDLAWPAVLLTPVRARSNEQSGSMMV